MAKTNIKTKIIKLINEVDFLTTKQKKDWLEIIEFMDEDSLNDLYSFFNNAVKAENEVMFRLLIKNGLQIQYLKEVDKISKQTIKKAKNKEK